jgi:hypothetical protein
MVKRAAAIVAAAVLAVLGALCFGGEQVPQTLGGPQEPCWWVTESNPPEPGSVCASEPP